MRIKIMNDITENEKKKQIEEAYKELEQQWEEEFEKNSDFYEELPELFVDDDYDEDPFEKIELINELYDFKRLGLTLSKELNEKSSIEELEDALEELKNAPYESWQEFERKKNETIEMSSSNTSQQPDIDEEDIMRAISEGYGDIYGY